MKSLKYYYILRNLILDVPFHVNMHYSDKCNLRCTQCINWRSKGKQNLTLHQKIYILNKLKKTLGHFYLILGGGEALLDPNIFKLIKFCKYNNIRVNIVTNATAIDENMAKKLSKFNNLNLIISLDGAKASTHDSLRGVQGTYNKLINAINFLHKEDFNRITINTVISGSNYRELEKLIDLCIDMKITKINFLPVMIKDYKNYKKEILWPKNIKSFNKHIDNLLSIKTARKDIINMNSVDEIIRIKKYFNNPFDKSERCGNDPNLIRIDRYGNLYICDRKNGLYGNILKDNLSDILSSKKRKELIANTKTCDLPCKFFTHCKQRKISQYINRKTLSSIIQH